MTYREDDIVRPQRAKKDTRRWCKGKVGREHRAEVRLSKWTYWRVRNGRPTCDPKSEVPWLTCGHEEYCAVCGKILRHSLGEDCPDRKAAAFNNAS